MQGERQRVPRKRLVSFRLDAADIERVRRIAGRLKARESDVFRFALALAFSRLALLTGGNVRGAELLPLLLEHGPDLVRHFNLDGPRLAQIVNAGTDGEGAIAPEDVELLAMRAFPDIYLHSRLHALTGAADGGDALERLRGYFYRKYFGNGPDEAATPGEIRDVETTRPA